MQPYFKLSTSPILPLLSTLCVVGGCSFGSGNPPRGQKGNRGTNTTEAASYEVKWAAVPASESYGQPRLVVRAGIHKEGGGFLPEEERSRVQELGLWSSFGPGGDVYLLDTRVMRADPRSTSPVSLAQVLQGHATKAQTPEEYEWNVRRVDVVQLPLQRRHRIRPEPVRFFVGPLTGTRSNSDLMGMDPAPAQLGTVTIPIRDQELQRIWVFLERASHAYQTAPWHTRVATPGVFPERVPLEAQQEFAERILQSILELIPPPTKIKDGIMEVLEEAKELFEAHGRTDSFDPWVTRIHEYASLPDQGVGRVCLEHVLELELLYGKIAALVLDGGTYRHFENDLRTMLGGAMVGRIVSLSIMVGYDPRLPYYTQRAWASIPNQFHFECIRDPGSSQAMGSRTRKEITAHLKWFEQQNSGVVYHPAVEQIQLEGFLMEILDAYFEFRRDNGDYETLLDRLEKMWNPTTDNPDLGQEE